MLARYYCSIKACVFCFNFRKFSTSNMTTKNADNNINLIVIQQLLRVQQQQTEDEQAVIAVMQRRRR